MNRLTALSLTMCCLSACGVDPSSSDDQSRDSLTPTPVDACSLLDISVCETTKGCELSANCPPCPQGQICPALACQLVCRSKIIPPPPSTCSGLDETTCLATKGCQPLYGGACPYHCDATSPCPPCTNGYLGCTDVIPPPVDHCAGLDERACNRTSGCQGDYDKTNPNLFVSCHADIAVCTVSPAGP
jgi:hypothetical protein